VIGGNDLDGFHEIRISKDRSIWVSTLEIRVVRKGKEIFHTRMDDIYLVRVLKQSSKIMIIPRSSEGLQIIRSDGKYIKINRFSTPRAHDELMII